MELIYAGQNNITKWTNDFSSISIYLPPPPRKSKLVVVLCGKLMVWNDLIGLLDIADKCKTWHLCYLWAICYFQDNLWKWHSKLMCSNHFDIVCIGLLDDCIYHILIWICTKNKSTRPYIVLCRHRLNFKQNFIIAIKINTFIYFLFGIVKMRLTVKLLKSTFFSI